MLLSMLYYRFWSSVIYYMNDLAICIAATRNKNLLPQVPVDLLNNIFFIFFDFQSRFRIFKNNHQALYLAVRSRYCIQIY